MSSRLALFINLITPQSSHPEVPYETSQSSHDQPSLRFDASRFVHHHGLCAEAGIRLMLQDEELLLPKQALLQKSKSRLLHG